MTICKLDDEDSCISCKVCGGDILSLIKCFEKDIDLDKNDNIEYQPYTKIKYFISIIQKEILEG